MPSDPSRYEIHYHPNANVTQLVVGGTRRTLVNQGGVTVAAQVARHITEGAVDRRPGSPNQLVGAAAVEFLEAIQNVS